MQHPFTSSRTTGVALAAFFLTASASAAVAQQSAAPSPPAAPGVIDCTRTGHGAACEVQLRPGQALAEVVFEPSTRHLGTESVAFRGMVLPGGVPFPIPADPGDSGRFRYTWTGTGEEKEPVRVLVQTESYGWVRSDTILIRPAKAPARQLSEPPNYAPYVWLSDNWFPRTIKVPITAESGPALTRAECEKVLVTFHPRAGGKAEPAADSARWESGNCLAETRWKLGDATGDQELVVVTGDGVGLERQEQVLTAYARQPPRIVVGYGLFTRLDSDRELYCAGADTVQERCKSAPVGADTLKREFRVRDESEGAAVFGLEFPVFFRSQPTGFRSTLARRVRGLVGSTLSRPEDNVFVGLTVIPLGSPAYERFSVQVQAAVRFNGGFMGALTVDGGELISSALTALGAPL